jgi:hypothetical protein
MTFAVNLPARTNLHRVPRAGCVVVCGRDCALHLRDIATGQPVGPRFATKPGAECRVITSRDYPVSFLSGQLLVALEFTQTESADVFGLAKTTETAVVYDTRTGQRVAEAPLGFRYTHSPTRATVLALQHEEQSHSIRLVVCLGDAPLRRPGSGIYLPSDFFVGPPQPRRIDIALREGEATKVDSRPVANADELAQLMGCPVLRVEDLPAPIPASRWHTPSQSAAFSPDGRLLACMQNKDLVVFDMTADAAVVFRHSFFSSSFDSFKKVAGWATPHSIAFEGSDIIVNVVGPAVVTVLDGIILRLDDDPEELHTWMLMARRNEDGLVRVNRRELMGERPLERQLDNSAWSRVRRFAVTHRQKV